MNVAERLYECMFCGCRFADLAFYGCCSHCYTGKPEIRAMVDGCHPLSRRDWREAERLTCVERE